MANTAVLEQPKRGESHGFTWVSAEGRQLSKTGEWDVVGQQHQILSAKVEPGAVWKSTSESVLRYGDNRVHGVGRPKFVFHTGPARRSTSNRAR